MANKKLKGSAKNAVKSKKGAPDFEDSFSAYKQKFYTRNFEGDEVPVGTKKELKERFKKGKIPNPIGNLIRVISKKAAPDVVLSKKEFRKEFNKQIGEKQPFKRGGLIKKSRGGMINGNDLVASYYDKGE